jgi:hypothetical protein
MIPPYIFARHLESEVSLPRQLPVGWKLQNTQFYYLQDDTGTSFVFAENDTGAIWVNTPETKWPRYKQLPPGSTLYDALDEIRDRHKSPMRLLSDILK